MNMKILRAIIDAQEMVRVGLLFARAEFIYGNPREMIKHINGCGAAGSWIRPPDKIKGVSILESCCIHDDDYHWGTTKKHKKQADVTFLRNMIRQIKQANLGFIDGMKARVIAEGYYLAVKWGGDSAFYG